MKSRSGMNNVSNQVPALFRIQSPFPIGSSTPILKRQQIYDRQAQQSAMTKLSSKRSDSMAAHQPANEIQRKSRMLLQGISMRRRNQHQEVQQLQQDQTQIEINTTNPTSQPRSKRCFSLNLHQFNQTGNQARAEEIKSPTDSSHNFMATGLLRENTLGKHRKMQNSLVQRRLTYPRQSEDQCKNITLNSEDAAMPTKSACEGELTDRQNTQRKPELKARLNNLMETDPQTSQASSNHSTRSNMNLPNIDDIIATHSLALADHNQHMQRVAHSGGLLQLASSYSRHLMVLQHDRIGAKELSSAHLESHDTSTGNRTNFQMAPIIPLQSIEVVRKTGPLTPHSGEREIQDLDQTYTAEMITNKNSTIELPVKRIKKRHNNITGQLNTSGKKTLEKPLQKPLNITKLTLIQKELIATQPVQPLHIKATERIAKRRITNNPDSGQFEVIDKRDVHLLDPGKIQITSRLRTELDKSLKKRDETPSNLTRINKMIKQQQLKQKKRQEKRLEHKENQRLISYVKKLHREGKAAMKQNAAPAVVRRSQPSSPKASKMSIKQHVKPMSLRRPTFYNPLSESRLTELKVVRQPMGAGGSETAPSTSFNNLSSAFASSQNMRSSRPLIGTQNDSTVLNSFRSSQTNYNSKILTTQPNSPAELKRVMNPLMHTSNSVKSVATSSPVQLKNQSSTAHTQRLLDSQQLSPQRSSHRKIQSDVVSAADDDAQESSRCPKTCATKGKVVYRQALFSQYYRAMAPYRNRYSESTKTPRYNAAGVLGNEKRIKLEAKRQNRMLLRTQRQEQDAVPKRQNLCREHGGERHLVWKMEQPLSSSVPRLSAAAIIEITPNANSKAPQQYHNAQDTETQHLSRKDKDQSNCQQLMLQGGSMKLSVPRPRTAKNSSAQRLQSHGSTTMVGGAHDLTCDRTDFQLGSSNAKKTTVVDYGDLMRVDSRDFQNHLSLIALIQQSNQELEKVGEVLVDDDNHHHHQTPQQMIQKRKRPVTSKPTARPKI